MEKRTKLSSLLPLFFLSGAAGLIYELSWIRECTLIFGAALPAVSVVTALFFGGMALGSSFLSRKGVKYSGKLLGKIECAVSVTALLSILLFALFRIITPHVYPSIQSSEFLLTLYRIAAAALTIGIPTFFIGAAFPVMIAVSPAKQGTEGSAAGLVNGVNALGAVFGTLLTGFVLMPTVGMIGSSVVGAVISLVVGILFWAGNVGEGEPEAEIESSPITLFPALPLFFAIGFAGMASQMVWNRFLALIIHNTVYTYTITIAVVILGISLGSILAGRLTSVSRNYSKLFGFAVLLNLTALIAALYMPASLWMQIGEIRAVPLRMTAIAAILLIPSLFAGAAFPAALKMVGGGTEIRGRAAGMLNAVNTFGGIIGSLLAGLVLIPAIGISGTASVIIAVLFVTVLFVFAGIRNFRIGWIYVLIPAAVLAMLYRSPTAFIRPYAAVGKEKIEYIKEGAYSTVVVKNNGTFKTMEIDRLWQGESRKTRQIMAAHIPMLLADSAERVMVIGVGAGVTAQRFTFYGADSIELIDLEPAVFDAAEKHFDGSWMKRPWIKKITADGRSSVMNGNGTYDLISIEIGQVFRPNAAGFYTKDFYEGCAKRLSKNGVVGQFVPVASFNPKTFRRVIASFIEVFPNAQLWYNRSEFLLVGFKGKSGSIMNKKNLKFFMEGTNAYKDLNYNYWGGELFSLNIPDNFAGGYLIGPADLKRLVNGAKPYRDAVPELEYAAAASEENPPFVSELIPYLSPIEQILPGATMRDLRNAELIRRTNLQNIYADELVLAFTRTGVPELLLKALEYNDKNIQVHRLLGDFYWKMGEYSKAEKHLMRAYAQDPGSFDAGYQIAAIRMKTDEMQKAVDILFEMLTIEPNDVRVHVLMGAAMTQVGRFDLARRHVLRALEIDTANAEAKRNLEYLNTVQGIKPEEKKTPVPDFLLKKDK